MSAATGPTSADKVGRNDPCPCGSGLKYKKCCSAKDEAARSAALAAQAAERAARVQAEREQAEAEGDAPAPSAKAGKPGVSRPGVGAARPGRPKTPTSHASNLPRRGAV
jgi:hypothetical protein